MSGVQNRLLATLLVVSALGACASGDGSDAQQGPAIAVTSNVLADVVGEIVGEEATVVGLMKPGVDPHDVQLTAKDAAELRYASLIITNGGGFESSVSDAVDSAESDGAIVFEALSTVRDPLISDGATDPHFSSDPVAMAEVVGEMTDSIVANVPGIDAEEIRRRERLYLEELSDLEAEMSTTLAVVPRDRRVLVTNHDVLAYFANRFDFEVMGSIISSRSTNAEANAAHLAELSSELAERSIPAIFTDATSHSDLADSLAAEAGGDVDVVELYTESLGTTDSGAETYIEMMETNAATIADALR